MFVIETLPAEGAVARDPVSGLPVRRLTGAVGHSHALYFTEDGWTADGKHLLLGSERACGNELYAAELSSGRLLRLSALHPGGNHPTLPHVFNYVSINRTRPECYCWRAGTLFALDLATGRSRDLYSLPAGHEEHGTSVTADGAWVLTAYSEDITARTGRHDRGTDRSAARAMAAARPHSRIMAIPTAGGAARVVFEDDAFITHVNASPTRPHLATFCHEGPWLEIDQRMWGLCLDGLGGRIGEPWAILPKDPAWGVGHEYWLADGETLGFHARHREGTWRHAAGFVRHDNSESWQAELAVPTQHAHAVTRDWVLLDGTREAGEFLLAVPREGDGWGVPRVLCRHDASRHHHRAHVHARIRSDGKQVVFTSDRRDYSDVYLVDVPSDIRALPPYPGKPYTYYWQ